MSQSLLYLIAAAVIFGIGAYGLMIAEHTLRKLFALNLMSSATFLLLIALGGKVDGAPDPVAQALVLTGIVVSVSITAFGLALMVRLYQETGDTGVSRSTDGRRTNGRT